MLKKFLRIPYNRRFFKVFLSVCPFPWRHYEPYQTAEIILGTRNFRSHKYHSIDIFKNDGPLRQLITDVIS